MLSALILGLIEGLTEFLPISSTAHLIMANKLLGLSQNAYWQFFEVFIQAGAILAVATVYFSEIFNHKQNLKLFFSFLPTAIVGFLLYDVIKNIFFNSLLLIATSLLFFGLIFLLIEWFIKNKKLVVSRKIENLTFKQALFIGGMQSLAVVPGVSRAGAALIGGLVLGYTRKEAAKYSFLLAVPTILMAAIFDLFKTDLSVVTSNVSLTLIGFISAYFSALLVIRGLMRFLENHNLVIFGFYRIILGILILASLV